MFPPFRDHRCKWPQMQTTVNHSKIIWQPQILSIVLYMLFYKWLKSKLLYIHFEWGLCLHSQQAKFLIICKWLLWDESGVTGLKPIRPCCRKTRPVFTHRGFPSPSGILGPACPVWRADGLNLMLHGKQGAASDLACLSIVRPRVLGARQAFPALCVLVEHCYFLSWVLLTCKLI